MEHKVALVVDDEPSVRHYMSAVLRSDGFQTLEASGGTEGFRLAQAVHGRLDLIVSDIQMPDGDGISLASSVGMEYPAIPCLLVSAFPQAEITMDVGFLQKPFLLAEFLRVVRKMTGQDRLARAG